MLAEEWSEGACPLALGVMAMVSCIPLPTFLLTLIFNPGFLSQPSTPCSLNVMWALPAPEFPDLCLFHDLWPESHVCPKSHTCVHILCPMSYDPYFMSVPHVACTVSFVMCQILCSMFQSMSPCLSHVPHLVFVLFSGSWVCCPNSCALSQCPRSHVPCLLFWGSNPDPQVI